MPKILHVDDDSFWRDEVTGVLRRKGYRVVSFGNLAEAKKALQKTRFDLIITDGRIHKHGDGLDWAEELCAQGHPVIICAAFGASGIPFVNKGRFPEAGEELLRLVKKLV